MSRVEDLRAQLAEAEAAERADRRAQMLAVPIIEQFVIGLDNGKRGWHNKLYDSTCCVYVIRRLVLNREAALAAGHSEHDLREGGMAYIYNKATERIICSVGGGTSWISDCWNSPSDNMDEVAFERIGNVLAVEPDGGDITWIIREFQEARRASQEAQRAARKV